ncbi:MAG: hypothetical protein V5A44_00055 [Haloarculaceae archaeon]
MEGPVHPASGGTHTGSLIEATVAVPRTDLQLRNYDDTAYAVELVVRDDDGVALTREYDLDPGECRAERGVLDLGTYEVRATTASGKRDTATCRVRTDPAATISVEVGNHVVNVLEGI